MVVVRYMLNTAVSVSIHHVKTFLVVIFLRAANDTKLPNRQKQTDYQKDHHTNHYAIKEVVVIHDVI